VAARGGLSNVPPVLRRNVLGSWGAAGERWLADLPRLAASVARDWELSLGEPFAMSYHWVAAAGCADGAPAVLKLGVPGEHLAHEAAALEAFAAAPSGCSIAISTVARCCSPARVPRRRPTAAPARPACRRAAL
jgi:hypothetical protein